MAPRTFTIPPLARKILGALALGAGVLVVGAQLRGSAPREVEVRLSLAAFRDARRPVREVAVTFFRGDAPVRSLNRRFDGQGPPALVETVQLPEGAVRAHVSVTLDRVVAERDSWLSVAPGEPLELPAPALPP